MMQVDFGNHFAQEKIIQIAQESLESLEINFFMIFCLADSCTHLHTRERIITSSISARIPIVLLTVYSRSFPLLLFILTSHKKFLVSPRAHFFSPLFSSPAFAVLGALVSGSLASGCRIGRQYYSYIGQPHCAPAWPRHVC